jgi:hypothetical protein
MIDYSGQENAIAAGLSGDPMMRQAYESGDIHMATAINCGLAPEGATEASHPAERNRIKPITHGSNYGISAHGVRAKLDISMFAARQLLHAYDRQHRRFRDWQTDVLHHAYLSHRITAPMGWSMHVDQNTKPRTLLNWMMQATGGEMLRAAVVMLVRAGFTICATAHDAVMLLEPVERLSERVAAAREIMERVSLSLTAGILVRTKATLVLPGQRLLDKETRPMWDQITGLLEDLTCAPARHFMRASAQVPAHEHAPGTSFYNSL